MNIVVNFVINPKGVEVPSENDFYPEDVASNVPTFFIVSTSSAFVLGIVSCVLIRPYEKDYVTHLDSFIDKIDVKDPNATDNSSRHNITISEIKKPGISFGSLFCSKETLLFLSLAFCSYCKYRLDINYITIY